LVSRLQIAGPQGLPLLKPPWGSIAAIDLTTGEHRWRAPVGAGDREHRALQHSPSRMGSAGRTGASCSSRRRCCSSCSTARRFPAARSAGSKPS
jgi:hypothetical protein